MKKLLVVGCSFAKGVGLENEDKNPKLWVNQLHQACWPEYELINLSSSGKNNDWIFLETMTALIKEDYEQILIEWTSFPRYVINIGLELYTTQTGLNYGCTDININNNETISGKQLTKLGDELRRFYNAHWDILNLVKYVNVLIEIQQKVRNNKILFVNGICQWPKDYFTKKNFTTPSELTQFEQSMFSVETREDNEIHELYNMVHNQYDFYGGIQEHLWLNLYESLCTHQIDKASSTDNHPGLLSQDLYVDLLKQKIFKG